MKIKLVAAIGRNNELGNKGGLPLWKLKSDIERFKTLTTGQVVVMGRKTFESFPEKFRPLPNRRNIVLTRDKSWQAEGAEVFSSFKEFLNTPSNSPSKEVENKEIWIIGGGEIYGQFINKADELHITHIDGEFVADTLFPRIDENIWQVASEEKFKADEKNSHDTIYRVYKKIC